MKVEVAKAFADGNKIPFLETSAKEYVQLLIRRNTNVNEAFTQLVREVRKAVVNNPTPPPSNGTGSGQPTVRRRLCLLL